MSVGVVNKIKFSLLELLYIFAAPGEFQKLASILWRASVNWGRCHQNSAESCARYQKLLLEKEVLCTVLCTVLSYTALLFSKCVSYPFPLNYSSLNIISICPIFTHCTVPYCSIFALYSPHLSPPWFPLCHFLIILFFLSFARPYI